MKHNFSKIFKSTIKNLFPKSMPASFPKSKKEESEFGKSKKGIVACTKCNSISWKGSWWHESDIKPKIKKDKHKEFGLCPACKMIENNEYEGEIVIENVYPNIRTDLINSIKNEGEDGFKKDPEDRVISIEKDDHNSKINVFTTENQLALKIGRKIKKSFNGTMKVIYSKKESVARIHITL
ncbi:MAG: hypothetical protein PHY30_01995 [Candidatus Pacebacteria bacterium]|nr:hypothetical protein [Candidatus Paceibacterota bacterium]